MIKLHSLGLAVLILTGMGVTPAFALIPNGDFETGDLSGYKTYHGLTEAPSTDLVEVVQDGAGNHLAQLESGFYSHSVINTGLAKDFGKLPADVQDLYFDVSFVDLGLYPGANTIGQVPYNTDSLWAYLETDGMFKSLMTLRQSDLVVDNTVGTSYELLTNGFYRFKTDMTPYTGYNDVRVRFELWDSTNPFQSKAFVDNIDLTFADDQTVAPEPSTMFLVGGGLAGMFLRGRKRMKS